jgi:H+/Cl- antiporter ClcA
MKAPESVQALDELGYAPQERPAIDERTLKICLFAVILGVMAAGVALLLMSLITVITQLMFFGRWSMEAASPASAVPALGLWVVIIPAIGGLIVGAMARYGSRAIRGHGIPEAMEQILTNRSRIPARMTVLKPVSSAVAIGTGGPFGAEGPIIATGGALGSLLGQFTACSPAERKTLLGAGAAAGMAATFGSPISAVLLAVELLLFEYRPRSLISRNGCCWFACCLRRCGASIPDANAGCCAVQCVDFLYRAGCCDGVYCSWRDTCAVCD